MIFIYLFLIAWLAFAAIRGWLPNILIGIDCTVSAMLGGAPGQTLSGRTGYAYLHRRIVGEIFCPVIDVIMHVAGAYPLWRGHCVHAIHGDELRAQAVLESRR